MKNLIPLYGIVSKCGTVFTLWYHGTDSVNTGHTKYDTSAFDDAPAETPLVDFRTAATADIMQIKVRPRETVSTMMWEDYMEFLPPLPTLSEYLEICRNAGALVTTIGEFKSHFTL